MPTRAAQSATASNPSSIPNTRTSNAVGLTARYYLPYRAAIEGHYRYFTDTWDMESHTGSLTYIHPWGDFTFTAKYRYHDQTGASFFNDIFPAVGGHQFPRARQGAKSAHQPDGHAEGGLRVPE